MKLFAALVFAVLLAGCAQNSPEPAPSADATTTTTGGAATPPEQPDRNPGTDVDSRQPKDGDDVAVIDTNLGQIVFMFFPDVAPKTVENFKTLASKGFYDGTKFHRVIPGFMIQGGDPNSKNDDRSDDGIGGSGTNVPAEFSMVDHKRGIVSMARSQDPNSASSQFFIVVGDTPSLNEQYTAFGKVVSGMPTADKIVNLKRDDKDNPLPENPAVVKSIKIEKWPVK
jgi:cyclophilin family peptidyl-prolyl cis-trans isomerase